MKKNQLLTDLSDEQCEKVVGGVGAGDGPGAGLNGWGAPGTPSDGHGLFSAGIISGQGFSPSPDMHGGVRVVHPK